MQTALPAKPTDPKADLSGLISLPNATARTLARSNPCGLRDECALALRMVEPVHPAVFAVEFERMALHYWEGRLSPAEEKVVKTDWLRLMGHLPGDLMREAVDRYLLSPKRFRPTPGQLLEMVADDLRYRQAIAKRASETLALLGAENGVYAPIGQEIEG
jgi:hypothetical protein